MNSIFVRSQKFYSENAETFFEETLGIDLSHSYKNFLSKLENGSFILDLGCGSGRDSNYFRGIGYQVESWEPNEELACLAEAYLEYQVKRASSYELRAIDKYNAIWASASLLHLNYEDFCETLPRIENALQAGGVFYSSYKRGAQDTFVGSRFFLMMTKERLLKSIASMTKLKIQELRIRQDHRPEKLGQSWLECVATKDS